MGLTQIATVVVAVLAFCLVAVTAQLAYVLWRKRRLLRRNVSGSELHTFPSRGGDSTATPSPSKELLYYSLLCLENKQFPILSDTAPPLSSTTNPFNDVTLKSSIGDNLLCGTSGTLFTIAEDCTSETDQTAEKEERGSVSMEDHEGVEERDEEGITTFSTPCGSPPFYTPSPSPIHDYASKASL